MSAARVKASPVYIESGAKRVFACSLDWPGLSRSGRTEEAALAALDEYVPRYAVLVARAGPRPGAGPGERGWEVVERVPTRSGGADFGVPTTVLDRDFTALTGPEVARAAALVAAAWARFDEVAAAAPPSLRKGPRGGGRDRDAIVDHVGAAEQMFAHKAGLKVAAPRGARSLVEANRAAILDWCRANPGPPAPAGGWPARFVVRRLLWHVLDHTWEIEDRRL